jgi:DNA primase, catalytic core
MSVIDEIKAKINIVDLVSETVPLRKSGTTYSGYCPFHENKHTPAFTVWPESGTWYCFGACGEGGDIFKFVMKRDGVDFAEARKRLAAKAGVRLEPFHSPKQAAEEARLNRLREVLEKAIYYYRRALFESPEGQAALAYLKTQRHLTEQTIKEFELGYSPNKFDALRNFLLTRGFTDKELFDAGLASQASDSERYYDRFRGRIMFPIRDFNGHPIGFGARVFAGDEQPKFLNSPQTPLFDKGRSLYGINAAHKAISKKSEAVIVEGYLDVIALHQAGFKNVVSPMGTALTGPQVQILKRNASRIILALDPDLAGQKAALRGITTTRAEMDHQDEVSFDARGLLQRESRLQADIRIATLPDGKDPDEVVAEGAEVWEAVIATARPIVLHVLETLLAQNDIQDPKAAAAIAGQVLPLIAEVANPVEREKLRQELAQRLKINEQALILPASPRRTAAGAKAPQAVVIPPATPDRAIEKQIASILFETPSALFQANRRLQQEKFEPISENDFLHEPFHTTYLAVLEAYQQVEMPPKDFLRAHLEEEVRETLTRDHCLLSDGALAAELVRLVAARRKQQIKERLVQATYLLNDPETDVEQIKTFIATNTQLMGRLDRARASRLIPVR